MRTAIALVLIVALAGCGSAADRRAERLKKRAAQIATEQEARSSTSDTVAPDSVPASYAGFPEAVRLIIYRADLLAQKCQGGFSGNRQSACLQREQLAKTLLAKGWCFGGAEDPSRQHWLLCAEDYPGGEGWIAGIQENPPEPQ